MQRTLSIFLFTVEISMTKYYTTVTLTAMLSIAIAGGTAHARSGSAVQPDTSVLVIEEADKEGSIGVKNTQDQPVLLYTKIQRLDDDDLDGALVPVPAAVQVQPGETQVVRVLFRNNKSLSKEHLARVQFMGIPPSHEKAGRVSLMIGQDLPVVIRPKGYRPVENKWEYLKWRIQGDQLCVSNDTKMAIRFVNDVTLQPNNVPVTMPKAYALPSSETCTALPAGYAAQAGATVTFSAVSDYSYVVNDRKATLDIVRESASEEHPSGGQAPAGELESRTENKHE